MPIPWRRADRATDRPQVAGQSIATVICVRDLRSRRATVRGGNRGQSLGDIVGIRRESLARQAVGDARLIPQLVVAVREGNRWLASAWAGGDVRRQLAIVVISEGQRRVGVGRAGHFVVGIIRICDLLGGRGTDPSLPGLVAIGVVRVGYPAAVGVGRIGEFAIVVINISDSGVIGLRQRRHAIFSVVCPLGFVANRIGQADFATSRVIGDRRGPDRRR